MNLGENDDEKDSLWAKGSFVEGVALDEVQEKMKTMHKSHDGDMNYNCKKCDKKISAHNKDWHDCMCDECFNKGYFSNANETTEIGEREIGEKLENFRPEEYSILGLCKETGTGMDAINDANLEAFMPLLMVIEETIWGHYSEDDSLKDSDVIESLKNIRNNILSNDVRFSEMENDVIARIKLVLFLNNYDKRDLSLSISKVLKSAKLHRSTGGKRGYLNFLSDFFDEMGQTG